MYLPLLRSTSYDSSLSLYGVIHNRLLKIFIHPLNPLIKYMLQSPQPNEYPIMLVCTTHRIGSKYKYRLACTAASARPSYSTPYYITIDFIIQTEHGVHNKCMILRTTRTDLKHVLLSGLYALYVRSTSEY